MSTISICIAIFTLVVHCNTVFLPPSKLHSVSHVKYASSVTDTYFLTGENQPSGASDPQSAVTFAPVFGTSKKERRRRRKTDSRPHAHANSSLPHDLETSGSEMMHFMPAHEDHHYHHCHGHEQRREGHCGCCHKPAVASVNLMLPHLPLQPPPMMPMMMMMPTMAPPAMPGMMNPMNAVNMMTQRLFWMAMG